MNIFLMDGINWPVLLNEFLSDGMNWGMAFAAAIAVSTIALIATVYVWEKLGNNQQSSGRQ